MLLLKAKTSDGYTALDRARQFNKTGVIKVLEAIDVAKDVDGFSAANIGNMCLRGGRPPLAVPCTPAGCVELLQVLRFPLEPHSHLPMRMHLTSPCACI